MNTRMDKSDGKKRASTPEEIDAKFQQYFESLPGLEDDAGFDNGIIDAAVRQQALIRETHPIAKQVPRERSIGDRVKGFLAEIPFSQSPRLGWVLGASFAVIVIASVVLIFREHHERTDVPLAADEFIQPSASSTSKQDSLQTVPETKQMAKPATDPTHIPPPRGKSMSFAAIPVVFNLRGGGDVGHETAADNMNTALQLLKGLLERSNIPFTTEASGNIVTNIMVWDEEVAHSDKLPLRFAQAAMKETIIILPEKFILDTTMVDATRLEALYRQLRIDIEDELRYQ